MRSIFRVSGQVITAGRGLSCRMDILFSFPMYRRLKEAYWCSDPVRYCKGARIFYKLKSIRMLSELSILIDFPFSFEAGYKVSIPSWILRESGWFQILWNAERIPRIRSRKSNLICLVNFSIPALIGSSRTFRSMKIIYICMAAWAGLRLANKIALKLCFSICWSVSAINRLNPVIRILATYYTCKGLENIWKGAGGHHQHGCLHLFRLSDGERILQ